MRKLFFIIGIIITLSGIFWACQGLGYIPWPQSSFMVNQTEWGYYGSITAFAGLVVMWFSRR